MDTSKEILLASNEEYVEYARLAPLSGSLQIDRREFRPEQSAFSGVFGRMDIGLVAFYRYSSAGLRLECEEIVVNLDVGCTAELERIVENGHRVIRIFIGPTSVVSLGYRVRERWKDDFQQANDFTWTEEEDFDFGLLIYNVLSNSDRFLAFYAK